MTVVRLHKRRLAAREHKHLPGDHDQQAHGHSHAGSVSFGEKLPVTFFTGNTIKSLKTPYYGAPKQFNVYGQDGKSMYRATAFEYFKSNIEGDGGDYSAEQVKNNMLRPCAVAKALGYAAGEHVLPVAVATGESGKSYGVVERDKDAPTLTTDEGKAACARLSDGQAADHFVFEYISGITGNHHANATMTQVLDGKPVVAGNFTGFSARRERVSKFDPATDSEFYLQAKMAERQVDWKALEKVFYRKDDILKAAKPYTTNEGEYYNCRSRIVRLMGALAYHNTHAQEKMTWGQLVKTYLAPELYFDSDLLARGGAAASYLPKE